MELVQMNSNGAQKPIARTNLVHDAWQAASLLVGLLGSDASKYAADKLAHCLASQDLAGATTWNQIETQIDLLLKSRTKHQVSERMRIGTVVE